MSNRPLGIQTRYTWQSITTPRSSYSSATTMRSLVREKPVRGRLVSCGQACFQVDLLFLVSLRTKNANPHITVSMKSKFAKAL